MLQKVASCERYCHDVFMSCKVYEDLASQWPALLSIDEPKTLLILEHFFDRFVRSAMDSCPEAFFYCRTCESFLTSVDGFVVDKSHPEDELVKLSDFVTIFEISTHRDFYRWAKNHLRASIWNGFSQVDMLKMPGIDRYHLSFRGITSLEHNHGPTDFASINLRLNLAIKDNTIERLQADMYNLNMELLDLRNRLESFNNNQTQDNGFVNEFFRQQAALNSGLSHTS